MLHLTPIIWKDRQSDGWMDSQTDKQAHRTPDNDIN